VTEVTGVTVHYTMTTDGNEPAEPTATDTEYTGAIDLTASPGESSRYRCAFKAFLDGSELESATVYGDWTIDRSAEFSISVPVLSLADNTYTSNQLVSMDPITDATVRFTSPGL
jgi:hypothetical protein